MPKNAHLALLNDLIANAQRVGADNVDAVLIKSDALSASVRLGAREDIERSEGIELGLRVFVGNSQAIIATSDLKEESLNQTVERAVAMAKVTPPDPYARLADESLLFQTGPELDLEDAGNVEATELANAALAAEDAARAVKGVSNSLGAQATWSRTKVSLATSHGFSGQKSGTAGSISVSVIAGSETAMERDYDYATARHWYSLTAPEKIGASAGEKAVKRLGAKKPKTGTIPVVFDPRVANSLLGHFAAAINGQSICRGASFLREKMGASVFANSIQIIDDPIRLRGLRSRLFDGEGVACRKLALVKDGVLQSWLLDSATAAQLELQTTGHAARAPSGPPSPQASNLYMEAGRETPEELISDIRSGFYVTDLIGMGVNTITGDYSRGAAGFLIEDGEITAPVSEVTIAGNLLDMFAQARPANDLAFRYATNAPTLRVDNMTLAGA